MTAADPTPEKKSHIGANMAGVGIIFGLIGGALGVGGNPLGWLLVVVALVLLIGGGVAGMIRPRS